MYVWFEEWCVQFTPCVVDDSPLFHGGRNVECPKFLDDVKRVTLYCHREVLSRWRRRHEVPHFSSLSLQNFCSVFCLFIGFERHSNTSALLRPPQYPIDSSSVRVVSGGVLDVNICSRRSISLVAALSGVSSSGPHLLLVCSNSSLQLPALSYFTIFIQENALPPYHCSHRAN
jgi:hypothetical protein